MRNVIGLMFILAFGHAANAQWPQFGGPTRDFRAADRGDFESWPVDGPRILWRKPLGNGYSGIVCDEGRLFTMYREGDDEIIICLNADDGSTIWAHRYGAPVDGREQAARYGFGPRATPLVVNDRIYAVGFAGKMYCLDTRNGRVIWSRDLLADFKGNKTRWGYACSPIAWNDTVILFTGGSAASVVALNQSDGRTRWKKHDYKNSYASPTLIDLAGQSQLVCFMMKHVVGLNPDDGSLYWEHPHENQWDNNIVTPVSGDDGLLFVTSEGSGGSRVLKLSRNGAKTTTTELWHSRKIKVSHRNAIRIGDTIYASTGDFGPKSFDAIDVHSGAFKWRQRDFPKCGLVLVANRLLMMSEDGRLMLSDVTDRGLTIRGESALLGEPAWTIPTVIGERVYLRDHSSVLAISLSPRTDNEPSTLDR